MFLVGLVIIVAISFFVYFNVKIWLFKNIVIFEYSGDCKILLYVSVAKYGKERYCGLLIVHFVLYTGKQTDRVKNVTLRHFL